MPRNIRIANLNAYKLSPTTRNTRSWAARVTAIQEIAPDILALQEFILDESGTGRDRWESEAASLIQDLSEECGLSASVRVSAYHPHGTAMAANWHRPRWTALMWNPHTVDVVEGSYRPFGAPDYWHGCTTARFDVGAKVPVLIASYHGDPFRPDYRYNEALRLKGTICTTGGVRPALCVGDFNSIWIRAPSRHRWEVDWSESIDKRSFSVIAGRTTTN